MNPRGKKLGNYIIAAFIFNVIAIMSVGGVCILLVKDMVANINQLKKESADVANAEDISNKIYKTTDSLYQAIIQKNGDYLIYAGNIIEDIENTVFIYLEEERLSPYDLNRDEVPLLEEILSTLIQIKDEVAQISDAFGMIGAVPPQNYHNLERLSIRIQTLSANLNRIHFQKISSLVQDSHGKMYFILFLYLVSSAIGILASCVGYIVLARNTVSPIKDLARATRRVAEGDLSIRVSTRSSTEIGTLYDSFNAMAERLEIHEKKREEFKRELELEVIKRTMELQDANAELKHAQNELVRMEKIATLGSIATTVNHEIKTPLNSLYLNLQLLTKRINKCEYKQEDDRDKMLSVTSVIDGEILRISEILEEFVKYARFAPPELKECDLNTIIEKLTTMIDQTASQAGVELKLLLADNLVHIMLDEKKITQALLNLCVNAIHAMTPGGGTLTIETKKFEENVTVTITDTGTGIAPDDLKKIFEPFFTKKEKGLGFGLAIVQRIIEDHKGWISCRSEEGKYTTFEIAFPLPGKEIVDV